MARNRLYSLPLIALFVGGCTNITLETGYEPRPIKATGVERRGYYAGPFTPAAREAAAQERANQPDGRRTNPGD